MKIKDYFNIVRFLGLRWLAFRGWYALANKINFFEKKLPVKSWNEINDWPEELAALSFIPQKFGCFTDEYFTKIDEPDDCFLLIQEAEEIMAGKFLLFSFHKKDLGFYPDWHKNHFTGESLPNDIHWAKIKDFADGDIKGVWELNRFSWAFVLARAYARTQNDKFAESFWQLFENWLERNQPNSGVNWKCGQEASIRLFACAFARTVFSRSSATTEERLRKWRKFVAFTAFRIFGNIDYALSQNNNHGISECVGLITACSVIPGISEASKMIAYAEKNLIRQLNELVYSDGAFSQHSTVYHRVVMHALSWLLALYCFSGKKVHQSISDAAKRLVTFMLSIIDVSDGSAPLHGPNDGADILPLSSSAYLDFRPCLQMLAKLSGIKINCSHGKHDEVSFWLGSKRDLLEFDNFLDRKTLLPSGWRIFKGPFSKLFVYSPRKFSHRPTQADLLHVDFWWKNQPIAIDAGSFSYNSAGKFASMLANTNVHNTVCVDNIDQLKKVSRFLYVPWPNVFVDSSDSNFVFVGSHNGYTSMGVSHERRILQNNGEWIIEDIVENIGKRIACHRFVLHWLFYDYPYTFEESLNRLILHTPRGDFEVLVVYSVSGLAIAKTVITRADSKSDAGWWSPYYYYAKPAISMSVSVKNADRVTFRTFLRPLSN